MQITEPVTMLTDYALAAASLAFALLLARLIGPRNRVSARLWCAAFAASAVAAVIGGTYHGFAMYFDERVRRALWNITIYSMGVSGGLMAAGIHSAYIRREDGSMKWLAYGILATLAGAIVQQSGFRSHSDFNHNDAYHVIQIFGLYFLFRCARLLQDRPGIST